MQRIFLTLFSFLLATILSFPSSILARDVPEGILAVSERPVYDRPRCNPYIRRCQPQYYCNPYGRYCLPPPLPPQPHRLLWLPQRPPRPRLPPMPRRQQPLSPSPSPSPLPLPQPGGR